MKFPCRYDPQAASASGLGILYGSPLGDVSVNQLFGVNKEFYGPAGHSGIDLNGWYGDPIRELVSGTVRVRGYDDKGGNWVSIDYGEGVSGYYCHLNEPSPLSAGDVTAPGTLIGVVGSTGESTGPHLHWTVNFNGVPVDPLDYFAVPEPLPPVNAEFVVPEEEELESQPLDQGNAIAAFNQIALHLGQIITREAGAQMAEVTTPPPPAGFRRLLVDFPA